MRIVVEHTHSYVSKMTLVVEGASLRRSNNLIEFLLTSPVTLVSGYYAPSSTITAGVLQYVSICK